MLFNNNTKGTYYRINTAVVVTRTRHRITLHVGRYDDVTYLDTVSNLVTTNTLYIQYAFIPP